jgi:hypothetical protein
VKESVNPCCGKVKDALTGCTIGREGVENKIKDRYKERKNKLMKQTDEDRN